MSGEMKAGWVAGTGRSNGPLTSPMELKVSKTPPSIAMLASRRAVSSVIGPGKLNCT